MKFHSISKLIILIAATVFVINTNSLWLSGLLFAVVLAAFLFLGVRSGAKKRLQLILTTAVLLVLFHLLFNNHLSLLERLSLGLTAGLRIAALSMCVFVYMSITSLSEILSLFSFLPNVYRLLVTITFSSIPTIFAEADRISYVQKSRGLKSSPLHPFPYTLALILPVLHAMFQRAQQLTMSIVSRGYEV